jgi:hypothetical protein
MPLRMLTNFRLTDLRLTTAQHRSTDQNLLYTRDMDFRISPSVQKSFGEQTRLLVRHLTKIQGIFQFKLQVR